MLKRTTYGKVNRFDLARTLGGRGRYLKPETGS